MVAELNEAAARKAAYSRRRAARSDADVDYINPRNAHFNKKIERRVWLGCRAHCVLGACVYV